MSFPINSHNIMLAIKDPDRYYPGLLEMMKFNMEFGSSSQFPCSCEECQKLTEVEIEALNQKLNKDLEAYA
jgi:hypothetical protein